VQTLGELLQTEATSVPSYIGNGILPVQGKLILGAERGFGKSILVSNMIYDLASGWNIFNEPLLSVSEPQRILYIENEVGEDGLRVRFGQHIHKAKQSSLALENIVIKTREKLLFLNRAHVGQPAQLEDQEQWLKLLEVVRPNIIVGDPLATLHDAEEGSNYEMGQLVNTLDAITEKASERLALKLSWIVVHHFRKKAKDEQVSMDSFRGAGRITDWADTRVLLDHKWTSGPDGVGHHYRRMIFPVVRQGPAIKDFLIWIDPCTLVPFVGQLVATEVGTPFG